MKHLQTFRVFETQNPKLTPKQVKFLDEHIKGTWSVSPSTELVDVKGDFSCWAEGLKDFNGIQFGVVTGDFLCSDNYLQTLEGAPQTVGGDFTCSNNSLQTLEGAPQTVGGKFDCCYNSLQTLEGAPQTVGGDFYCEENSLKTLKGAPQTVGGNFNCSDNSLQTLEGAPQTVGGAFSCQTNSLQTLVGAPQTVGGEFYCHNNSLQTLVGAPQTVGGGFWSDHVNVSKGEWSLSGLVQIYLQSKGKKKKILETLVSPEAIQKAIDQNPEKMAVELKGILKDLTKIPGYQNLKFPAGLQGEVDLLTNLSDVGL
jgi:hypothetical protein